MALRWALLALALLLIVLCDGLHGAHGNPLDAPHSRRSADSGDRDGAQYPDQSAKPRRRVATGPVHDGDGAQVLPLTVLSPAPATPSAAALPAALQPARHCRHAACPVPRLSRGQDPPPAHV